MKKENCGFDTKIMTLLFHRLLAHRNVKDVVRQAKVHVNALVRIQFKNIHELGFESREGRITVSK